MTSKISYFKFIESDIKHRGWLAALTCAALFFMMPLHMLLALDNLKQNENYAAGTEMLHEWIANATPGILNGALFISLGIAIGIFAILSAATGFAYLHSREKQDFYHGMPIRRTQWFWISYTGGLLIFLIPYLLFGICTILVAGTNFPMNASFLGNCLIALLGGVLGFLICYNTAILAMFLTGKSVTGVLASLVLMVYGSLLPALVTGLEQSFFASWSDTAPDLLQTIQKYCSPAALFVQTLAVTAFRGEVYDSSIDMSVSGILISLIAAALILAVTLLLSRRYPAEASENALAFPKTAPFIKFLIAVPTAMFIGLAVKFFNGSVSVNWILVFSILSVILLCMVIEFIYHQDLTKLLSGKVSTALSLGVVLILICTLKFDVFGYDSYLPKENKIESMSVHSDQFTGYFSYPRSFQSLIYNKRNDDVFAVEDFAPLYELAKEGIQNLEQGATPQKVIEHDSTYEYTNITIRYQLHNGRNIYRKYAVTRDGALQAVTQLCKDEEYRKMLFPIFHIDPEEVKTISMEDIYYQPVALTLNRKQQDQLLEAYKKDVLAADIPDMQYEAPLGELVLGVHDSNSPQTANGYEAELSQLGLFYVYSSYKNTLDTLEEYGYTLRRQIDPEDVMFMTYYPSEYSEADTYARKEVMDYDFGEGISITEPEEIEKMLGKICYDKCNGLFGGRIAAAGSVEITLTEKSYPNSYAVIE